METAYLAGGCFWCVEAIFQRINGITELKSGYCNGSTQNPSYESICSGQTGHAEVVQIVFDPEIVSLSTILEVFFATHDPTTLNRQGADSGTQYRSAIFTHEKTQLPIIEVALIAASAEWAQPIVTEITAATAFYKAEDYHQDYFEINGEAPYCQAVIAPKMNKFREKYRFLLNQ